MRRVRPHRPAARRRTAVLALTAAVTTLVAGCTVGPSTRPPLATSGADGAAAVPQSTASTMPTGPGGPGRASDPISWSSCDPQIQTRSSGRTFHLSCAQVQVPKSYSAADSGTFVVSVARATTDSTPAAAPPLVVIEDEAGRNGTHQIATVAGQLPAEILQHFAVIVVDIRGTGDSVPIDCVSGANSADLLSLGADPTTSVAGTLLADLSRQLTFDCGDLVGPDLSDYSSISAADDLDTVRAALGADKIALLGRGFGATLGAVYANRYPGRVGAAVLDGPSDPSLTPDKQATLQAAALQQALTSFTSACATFTGGCPLGSDPAKAVTSLVADLGDVGAPTSDHQEITGGSVLLLLTQQLGDPSGWPALASALADARKQQYDAIAELLLAPLGADNPQEQQAGRLVYQCNDTAQRLSGAALTTAANAARAAAPLFGPFLTGLVGVCGSWPAPDTALGPVTATGAAPILIVGSVDDPVSPFTGVRSLTAQMDSATLLTWQSGTHGGYLASKCVTSAADAYLLRGTMPATGMLCPP
ncbi:TAP-like protein [Nakamurella panacisegetis]|uniref:TAP-like protein n=1 Tax=Nakamurella panacisegetis TaxID=1090615 RepID=A0A1H0QKS5_9ACTN|nr:alpha/beta hydrolase [Nakamurella panacisegetis]SDP17336.1 TAP-like protein [Nakamurella panacisegetis]